VSYINISEIFIKKYGKFEDFSLPLKGGFNLIYGENETGKTTLNSFIRRMAYGMPLRDRSGLKTNDRLRYNPITGGNMQGSLKLDIGSGEKILVSRTFGKTAAGDKLSVLNDTTGEEVPRFRDGENLGEILFGCSDGMFEKTLWFKQNGTYMGGNDDEITRRLINLAVSGDEDISAKAAAEKLMTLQKSLKAPDNRSAPGKIDKIQRELNELTDERLRLEQKQEQLSKQEGIFAALLVEQTAIEKNIEKYQELQKSVEAKQKFEIMQKIDRHLEEIDELKKAGDYVDFANVDEQIKIDISEKNSQIEEIAKITNYDGFEQDNTDLKIAKKKRSFRAAIVAIGGVIAAAAGAVYAMMIDDWYLLMIALLGIVIVGFALNDVTKISKVITDLQGKIDAAASYELDKNTKIDILKCEIDKIYCSLNVTNYSELLERMANADKISTKIELLEENIRVLLDGKDLIGLRRETEKFEPMSQVLEMNKTRIDETLNNGQTKLLQISEKIQDAKRNVNMLRADEQTLVAVISNIAKCEEDLEKAKFELDAVKLSIHTLDVATSEMKNNFTPHLNSAANEVISDITNGKYRELRISEDLNIRVQQGGELIEGEILSAGAFDQIYFSLRIAIIKLLGGENKILFLDDTFTQYDDVRAKLAFDYILKLSKECQVIMFTCQFRELEMAKRYEGINVVML